MQAFKQQQNIFPKMDFGYVIYSPLNFTQDDTKTSFIPFFSRYMTFFAFDYRTISSVRSYTLPI